MTIFDNISNKVSYAVHKLSYDPMAEMYATSKKADEEKESSKKAVEAAKIKEEKERLKNEEAIKKATQKVLKKEEADSKFSILGMIGDALGTATTIILVFVMIGVGILGASLATNLNVYRDYPYRIFYALYGFVFSPIVILYCYGYRMLYLGKRPVFYGLMPMVPYHFDNKFMRNLFSWLSFRPDDQMHALEEWKIRANEHISDKHNIQ
jgi:hypothetical protein